MVTFFVMVIAAAAYLAKVTNMGDATFTGRKALHVFGVMAGVWLGWFLGWLTQAQDLTRLPRSN